MLSLNGYLLIVVGLLGICALATAVAARYERSCPQCCASIVASASRCRHCGYVMT